MKRLINVILVISIFLILLVNSIEIGAYNKQYYKWAFNKNNTEEVTGKSEEELLNISDDLIKYLKSNGNEEILEKTFNEREVLHMIDVQNLFILARNIRIFSFIIFLICILYFYKSNKLKNMLRSICLGLNFVYIFVIGLFALIYTNFNKYFIIFHELLFDNDLWLLDPKTDLMIQMLPEPFFINMAILIGLVLFFSLLVTQIISYVLFKKLNKRKDTMLCFTKAK